MNKVKQHEAGRGYHKPESPLSKVRTRNSGFTLMELLVVISVLTILTILAVPKFSNNIEEAKIVQIINDINITENTIEFGLLRDVDYIKPTEGDKLDLSNIGGELYTIKGKCIAGTENPIPTMNYRLYQIPQTTMGAINTQLNKDNFYITEDNQVYYIYVGKTIADSGDGEGEGNEETEFTFVEDSSAPGKYTIDDVPNTRGYFQYTGDATEVVIPEIIHGNRVTDYYKMFMGTAVTKVTSESDGIVNMAYMFYDTTYTGELDLSGLKAPDVMNMSYMFYNSLAASLDLNNFRTPNVTIMSSMFEDSGATLLDLSKFDTSNVSAMERMFNGSKATTIDISNFDISKVTNMKYMFSGSVADPIYAKDQAQINKYVSEGTGTKDRFIIGSPTP